MIQDPNQRGESMVTTSNGFKNTMDQYMSQLNDLVKSLMMDINFLVKGKGS
eukprot:c46677_g1_i1 orf=1-150(-)